MNELMIADYKADGIDIHLDRETVYNFLTDGRDDIPDKEVAKFIQLCMARELNPFLGEVYLVPYNTQQGVKANIIVGKDTFMKRAYREPDFDGIEAGIVIAKKDKDGEVYTIDRPGTIFSAVNGETLVGGWARVHSKTRKIPTYSSVLKSEYSTGKSLWSSKPATMIRKVAMVQALRDTYPEAFNGLYDSAEMGQEEPKPVEAVVTHQEATGQPKAIPCPNCEGESVRSAKGYWCANCQQVVVSNDGEQMPLEVEPVILEES